MLLDCGCGAVRLRISRVCSKTEGCNVPNAATAKAHSSGVGRCGCLAGCCCCFVDCFKADDEDGGVIILVPAFAVFGTIALLLMAGEGIAIGVPDRRCFLRTGPLLLTQSGDTILPILLADDGSRFTDTLLLLLLPSVFFTLLLLVPTHFRVDDLRGRPLILDVFLVVRRDFIILLSYICEGVMLDRRWMQTAINQSINQSINRMEAAERQQQQQQLPSDCYYYYRTPCTLYYVHYFV